MQVPSIQASGRKDGAQDGGLTEGVSVQAFSGRMERQSCPPLTARFRTLFNLHELHPATPESMAPMPLGCQMSKHNEF